MSSKSLASLKIDESTIESMKKLGEEYSSVSFLAAPNSHQYVDFIFSLEDRIKERGEFKVELVLGYSLEKVIVTIKDGMVQLENGDWVPVITGFKSFTQDIQRANERESWKNMAIAAMEDKLALATAISASRKASKRAEKKKLEKFEKLLKIKGELFKEEEETDE